MSAAGYGIERLNPGQRSAFDEISAPLKSASTPNSEPSQRLFFVHGTAGAGKTFLYNTLIAWCHANGHPIMVCASTGIAATLLDGGATAHSLFSIPICLTNARAEQDEISQFPRSVDLIRKARILILDEIGTLHRRVFHYIDRVMRRVRNCEAEPFGGAAVVCSGDFAQQSPVVPGARSVQAFLTASVHSSPPFSQFRVLRLTQNMRVTAGEREFSMYLAQLARGATTVKPSIFRFVRNVHDLVSFCFPENELQEPFVHAQEFGRRAILAPHRKTVEQINDLVIGWLPSDARIYYSEQTPENADGPGEFPPHELVLKKGCIIMLVRNISLEDKLCNGMRFILEDMNDRFLLCRSLLDGQQHKFYRMTFTAKDFTRKQFPVIPGYALTITRAQGCTLDRMALHLEKDCFAHGSLFTALSRVRSKESVRVLYSKPWPIRNVVYKEFLE